MQNVQLANNLQYLRTKHGLTQKELSKQLNISRQAYSNYETRKRTPDLDSMLRLAALFEVSVDSLILCNLKTGDTSAMISDGRIPYTLSVNKNTGNSIYATEEELDLITKFRSLSAQNQQIVTGFINEHSR